MEGTITAGTLVGVAGLSALPVVVRPEGVERASREGAGSAERASATTPSKRSTYCPVSVNSSLPNPAKLLPAHARQVKYEGMRRRDVPVDRTDRLARDVVDFKVPSHES